MIGEEAVAKIVDHFKLPYKSPSVTQDLLLISNHPIPGLKDKLVSEFKISEHKANYLIEHYGTRSLDVAKLGTKSLIEGYPFIEGEVVFGVRNEYALHPSDVLARRLRIALINYKVTNSAIQKVANIMGTELNWSEQKKSEEISKSLKELQQYFPY